MQRDISAIGRDTEQWTTIAEAAKKMVMLRNQLVHRPSAHDPLAEAKPAYSLDEGDE